jgi:hypothetical protein
MAREESFFDELARGLADGSVTRGKALRLMGGALVGAALASFPGVAWANDRCSEGQTRCGDRCVNLKTNERHCGSCRNRCGTKQTCCGGRCVNLKRSERHCGSCSNRCAEGEECVDGVCGGEPICTPPCPSPCGCFDRADGTGTVCVDCSTHDCPQVSSCDECTAAGRVCFGAPGNFNCGDPCQTMCIPTGSSSPCTAGGTPCCSGNCNSNGFCCESGRVGVSNGTCALPCTSSEECPGFPCGCLNSTEGGLCAAVQSGNFCDLGICASSGELCSFGVCFTAC